MRKINLAATLLFLLLLVPALLQACQKPANTGLEVLSLDVIPAKVFQGEKATVKTEIKNSSDTVQTYTVPLVVNKVAEDRTTFTLAPGATKILEFLLVRSDARDYTIRVGEQERIFEVRVAPPPSFEVSDLKVSPAQVDVGKEVLITVKITNVGGSRGSYTVDLKINDATEKKQTYNLTAGQMYDLGFLISRSVPGTYSVALGELKSEFAVTEPIIPVQIAPPVCPPSTKWDPGKKC